MMSVEQLRGIAAHARAIVGIIAHAQRVRERGETPDIDVVLADVLRHAAAQLDELGEGA